MPQTRNMSMDSGSKTTDMRRDRRYYTHICGRFVAAGVDTSCLIVDLSAGGAKLKVDAAPAEGDSIALNIPDIGFVRGFVCRVEEEHICVTFELTRSRREHLAEKIVNYHIQRREEEASAHNKRDCSGTPVTGASTDGSS